MLELLTGRKSYDRLLISWKETSILIKNQIELTSYLFSANVVLSLKTCRSLSRGEQSLVRWAIHQLHDIDALSRMVDPSIKGACPVKSLSRFADIISRCVQASFPLLCGWIFCSWCIIYNWVTCFWNGELWIREHCTGYVSVGPRTAGL